jgi:thiosulfate/3-mercaptopyruvate sulfurtransferase
MILLVSRLLIIAAAHEAAGRILSPSANPCTSREITYDRILTQMSGHEFLIGVDDLNRQLGQFNWRVMDCRHDLMQPAKGYEEYGQAHIPGAHYANLDEDLAGPVTGSTGRHPLPSPKKFAKTLGRWGIGNETQVVAYDHASGAVAARLWWMLKWLGHDQVAVLDGGYSAWQKAGLPVSAEDEDVTPLQFYPSPNADLPISTDDVRALIESGAAPPIVDARDPVRFVGQREPIDAVAGHIPGAVNCPFSESVDSEGRWKDPASLRETWARILGDDEDRPWVSMCGSGVTACHLALSAGLAGYRQPRLYVGSWSEWIRDPQRPIATDPE